MKVMFSTKHFECNLKFKKEQFIDQIVENVYWREDVFENLLVALLNELDDLYTEEVKEDYPKLYNKLKNIGKRLNETENNS